MNPSSTPPSPPLALAPNHSSFPSFLPSHPQLETRTSVSSSLTSFIFATPPLPPLPPSSHNCSLRVCSRYPRYRRRSTLAFLATHVNNNMNSGSNSRRKTSTASCAGRSDPNTKLRTDEIENLRVELNELRNDVRLLVGLFMDASEGARAPAGLHVLEEVGANEGKRAVHSSEFSIYDGLGLKDLMGDDTGSISITSPADNTTAARVKSLLASKRKKGECSNKRKLDVGPVLSAIAISSDNTNVTPPLVSTLTIEQARKFMHDDHGLTGFLFSLERDSREVVVDMGYMGLTRAHNSELLPGFVISSPIVDYYVSQLCIDAHTNNSRMVKWYLPTQFSQQIIQGVKGVPVKSETLQQHFWESHLFTRKLVYCQQMFIPANFMNAHWFLVIIDFHLQEVFICDSQKNEDYQDDINAYVKKLVIHLDKFFKHVEGPNYKNMRLVYDFPVTRPPWVLDQLGAVDCGVYCCTMMKNVGSLGAFSTMSSTTYREDLALEMWHRWGNLANPAIRYYGDDQ